MAWIGKKKVGSTSLNNRIVWIILAYIIVFVFIGSFLVLGTEALPLPYDRIPQSVFFILNYYVLGFLPLFVLALVYFGCIRKNRFIFDKLLPSYKGNTLSKYTTGLAAGFLMNTICVLAALVHGDIRLSFDFSVTQIPFLVFAFVCVCLQSATEEIWCRGFLQERINVHYPFWAAALFSSLIFGIMHLGNPGITALAFANLVLTGIAYSIAYRVTNSIWFAIGVHTAWNFTQNIIFGLPNSGLVSEESIFRLEAMTGTGNLVYDPLFGVEGALPCMAVTVLLAAVCVWKAAQDKQTYIFMESYEAKENPLA